MKTPDHVQTNDPHHYSARLFQLLGRHFNNIEIQELVGKGSSSPLGNLESVIGSYKYRIDLAIEKGDEATAEFLRMQLADQIKTSIAK